MDESGKNSPPSKPHESLRVWQPLLFIALAVCGLLGVYIYRWTAGSEHRLDLAKQVEAELERRKFKPLSASLETLLADAKYEPVPTQTHAFLLQDAPDFTLPEVDGKEWSLAKDGKDKPVVVVFYYGYTCDHCVSQLFAIEKDLDKFRELGAEVVAISPDTPEFTLKRYAKYGRFHFKVASDADKKVAEKYQTYFPKENGDGELLHGTFVIDRKGRIVWANRGDEPFTNNRTLLHEIARSEGRLPTKADAK